jgi:RNA polymerase sigma factor (TIGR02999 family)
VTELLTAWSDGDRDAQAELLPRVYDELRQIAARHLSRERAGHTLQATALVHEAYLRLLKDKRRPWRNRAHFFAIAATSMRQILVERARARGAAKRGGSRVRVSLADVGAGDKDAAVDVLVLDDALERLAAFDPQLARIVELRFFAGLSLEEVAEALSSSVATVKRNWSVARAWLRREMAP